MRELVSLLLLLGTLGCSTTTPSSGGFVEQLPDISSNFGSFDSGAAVDSGSASDTANSDVNSTDVTVDTTAVDTTTADVLSADTASFDGGAPDTSSFDIAAPDVGGPDASDAGVAPCGDGTCSATENCQTCPADCGFCPKNCGDKTCDGDENCKNCPGDCGQCPLGCGDGTCSAATENCQSCPLDCGKCPAICGDKSCNGTETCTSCPLDCGPCAGSCGDGKCDATKEDCKTCSADCGQCPGAACEPLTSKGCTAAQQCYPTATAPLCGTPGSKAAGAACTLTTDCSKGLLCVGKLCKPLCDSSGANATYKCAAGKCDALQYSDGKPVGYNLGTCVIYNQCNLLTDVGCATSQACVNLKDGKACISAGVKKVGEGCTYLDECVKGTMCIGNPSMCMPKCNSKGGTPSCSSGKQCLVVTSGAANTPLPDDLGVCSN